MMLVERKSRKNSGNAVIIVTHITPTILRSGDTVRVHVKVTEGARERIQVFEGVVIARKHGGVNETFTVRKISNGVGVERVFPILSMKNGLLCKFSPEKTQRISKKHITPLKFLMTT
jgi:hypothetical protein